LESLSEKWSTTDFQLIIRAQTMRNQLKDPKHRYKRCYSTPILWAHVNTDGEICGCPAYLSDTRFSYGNINEMTFIEIWEGEKRQESFEYLSKLHDISKCRVNCRMNAINEYLSNLIEGKIPHVNFI
jgi:radical SAM protein with 4Fe4S-binding SPASM domain